MTLNFENDINATANQRPNWEIKGKYKDLDFIENSFLMNDLGRYGLNSIDWYLDSKNGDLYLIKNREDEDIALLGFSNNTIKWQWLKFKDSIF